MIQVLLESVLPQSHELLLADVIATHIFLNSRCLKIFQGLDEVDQIILIAGVTPSFLDPGGSLYSILLQLFEELLRNETPGHRLDFDSCIALL